ncbi:DUF3141 domain-containing protein, partial [Xanthobacter sp. DSM 24535]|uniref:DUF3141 domain-containing protein n=1 Tax=Roseixanthobacter psychrophilus TaxID=3119917 RepID=UPI003726AB55
QSLPRIETLPPGLYEMKIDNPSGDPDCRDGGYAVHFEAREVCDIRFPRQDDAFERVRDLSERNEAFYRT